LANDQLTPREEDVLIHEWETIIHYWAADNSVVLTWCTMFILVNSILFALLAIAPTDSIMPIWVLKYVGPSLGIVVNAIWGVVNARLVAYLRHFHDLVMDIQKKVPVLRFQDPQLLKFRWYENISAKTLVRYIPILFFIVWIIILIALID